MTIKNKAKKKDVATTPTISKAQIKSALARTKSSFTKYATFTNVFGMKNTKGLGKYNKDVIVFKKGYMSSPRWSIDPFGTKYCSGFQSKSPCIIMLLIPQDALVVRGQTTGYYSDGIKHRADKAYVVGLYTSKKTLYKLTSKEKITGTHRSNGTLTYAPKIWVKPKKKFEMGDAECASGVHFFRTFGEAKSWR